MELTFHKSKRQGKKVNIWATSREGTLKKMGESVRYRNLAEANTTGVTAQAEPGLRKGSDGEGKFRTVTERRTRE